MVDDAFFEADSRLLPRDSDSNLFSHRLRLMYKVKETRVLSGWKATKQDFERFLTALFLRDRAGSATLPPYMEHYHVYIQGHILVGVNQSFHLPPNEVDSVRKA